MSEVIISPGTQARTQFGLEIINELPVRLIENPPNPLVQVIGSAGKDIFRATNVTSTVPYDIQTGADDDIAITAAGADILDGGSGDDSLDAGAGNDTLIGGLDNDALFGGDGNDTIIGDAGDDDIFGGTGDDFLRGEAGDDQIFGDEGNDNLRGGSGNDVLVGGDGNDVLQGDDGDDVLNPGAGQDILRGGAGADHFRFEPKSTGGNQLDIIQDFTPQEDVIELSRGLLPGSGLKTGQLKPTDFQVVQGINGASDAAAKILYDRVSGIVYYNPSQGVEVPLLQIQKDLNVTANDFRIF